MVARQDVALVWTEHHGAGDTLAPIGQGPLLQPAVQRATPIGANDLWIACHALALDATLVSLNVGEFARLEGFRLEDWAFS